MYYVSLKGVTGANSLDIVDVADNVAKIRKKTQLPIAVGFGIKDAASAKAVAEVADGVVVGSVLVSYYAELVKKNLFQADQPPALLQAMRQAINELAKRF